MEIHAVVDVTIDFSDVDNVNSEHVTIGECSNLRTEPIAQLAKDCPKGFGFLEVFSVKVADYMHNLEEERKRVKTMNRLRTES